MPLHQAPSHDWEPISIQRQYERGLITLEEADQLLRQWVAGQTALLDLRTRTTHTHSQLPAGYLQPGCPACEA